MVVVVVVDILVVVGLGDNAVLSRSVDGDMRGVTLEGLCGRLVL